MSEVTSDTEVKRLLDRAEITDLLYKFAHALDTKQWARQRECYAEDGVLELPWATITRQQMEEAGAPKGLVRFHSTHHIISNPMIEVDGDSASSNAYFQATHVRDPEDSSSFWVAAGWYDNEYRRTAEGWRLTRVRLSTIWETGEREDH